MPSRGSTNPRLSHYHSLSKSISFHLAPSLDYCSTFQSSSFCLSHVSYASLEARNHNLAIILFLLSCLSHPSPLSLVFLSCAKFSACILLLAPLFIFIHTILNERVCDSSIDVGGNKLFRHDRALGCVVGTCVFVKSSYVAIFSA